MSDFIMTMDDRSDVSSDSEDQDTGISFDFNVRFEFIPDIDHVPTIQFNPIPAALVELRNVMLPSVAGYALSLVSTSN